MNYYSNITALVNALIVINLMKKHFFRKESLVKLIKFERIEIENSNKWLKKYNRIIKAN